jgi:hypothetical protein
VLVGRLKISLVTPPRLAECPAVRYPLLYTDYEIDEDFHSTISRTRQYLAAVLEHLRGDTGAGGSLGECTHGMGVFQLKHRLLEYLLTHKLLSTLSFKFNYRWGEILNEYTQTGVGDSLTIYKAASFHVRDTIEFWNILEWLRAYNQTSCCNTCEQWLPRPLCRAARVCAAAAV